MRRPLTALVVALCLLLAFAFVLHRHDRPPLAPGAWLDRHGLEARYLTVHDHRIRYVRAGQGPAVVLVHGFASSIYTWAEVIPALAGAHDVVALDLPGFGASELPSDLSFDDLPAAVLGLMDALGLERAALVGNSMGGAVAAVVAADTPERVGALVLVDAAGFNAESRQRPATVRLVTSSFAPLLGRLPGKRLVIERSLQEVFYDDRHVTDERVSEYLAAALRPGSVAAMRSLLLSVAGRGTTVTDRLARIQAPTLIIWGREDRWIPVEHADLFEKAIPGSRKVVLNACGQLPHAEKPEVVAPLILEFLSEANPETSSPPA